MEPADALPLERMSGSIPSFFFWTREEVRRGAAAVATGLPLPLPLGLALRSRQLALPLPRHPRSHVGFGVTLFTGEGGRRSLRLHRLGWRGGHGRACVLRGRLIRAPHRAALEQRNSLLLHQNHRQGRRRRLVQPCASGTSEAGAAAGSASGSGEAVAAWLRGVFVPCRPMGHRPVGLTDHQLASL